MENVEKLTDLELRVLFHGILLINYAILTEEEKLRAISLKSELTEEVNKRRIELEPRW